MVYIYIYQKKVRRFQLLLVLTGWVLNLLDNCFYIHTQVPGWCDSYTFTYKRMHQPRAIMMYCSDPVQYLASWFYISLLKVFVKKFVVKSCKMHMPHILDTENDQVTAKIQYQRSLIQTLIVYYLFTCNKFLDYRVSHLKLT